MSSTSEGMTFQETFDLDGRVAVVTGGHGDLAEAIAGVLAELGCALVLAARNVEPCEELAQRLAGVHGISAMAVPADVTSEADVDRVVNAATDRFGRLDVLINSAATFWSAPAEEVPLERGWQRVLDVNLTGSFLCARRALGGMRAAGYGRVVFIGSSAGINGAGAAPPPLAPYAASKAGVHALAKSVALEYAASGVTANALAPTLIDTGMLGTLTADFRGAIPVGRYGTPHEVAAVAAFLCSAHAGYITGEVVDVNGGYLID
jgi:gluconate 5-dehydrogenase